MGKFYLVGILFLICISFSYGYQSVSLNCSDTEIVFYPGINISSNYFSIKANYSDNYTYSIPDFKSYFRFEDNLVDNASYSTVVDSSDVAYLTGKYGQGLSLVTPNVWARFDTITFENKHPTISAWVKPNKIQTQIWTAKKNFEQYYSEIRSNGLKCCFDTGTETCVTNSIVPQVGVWTMVTCTYDGSQICSYVGNTGTCGAKTGNIIASAQEFIVGNGMIYSGCQECFNGTIDSIRVYDRVLSNTEISKIYESEFPSYSCSISSNGIQINSSQNSIVTTARNIESLSSISYSYSASCNDGFLSSTDSCIRTHDLNDFFNYANFINDDIENLSKVNELIAFVLLWIGLWVFGYYVFQTGNPLLGGTMIVLTIPIDLFFAYRFQETLMLATGFLGVAFTVMSAWTFGMIVFLKRKVHA